MKKIFTFLLFFAILPSFVMMMKAQSQNPLAYLQQQNLPWALYSDSKTAIAWVRQKQCKTKLAWSTKNQDLLLAVRAAEKWLHEHTWTTPIYKWDTEHWGEIPADFGRK